MSKLEIANENRLNEKLLLSICIPTYNRSEFLRVMLQALLPQVAEFQDQVEVWIIDNASPDDTQEVLRESEALGPFHNIRNDENIGPLRNILKGPCELVRGEYVWILGDHNLMIPGALHRILTLVSANNSLDAFYSNFRCAEYPEQWPADAVNGYDGSFRYIGNNYTEDRPIRAWSELLDPASAFCTQVYAHIVRTKIWRNYWRSIDVDEPYQDALTTYPHTRMLVDVVFGSPSFYSGKPAITIYNGAQSWGNPETQCAVYLRGIPDLLKRIALKGTPTATIQEWKRGFCTTETTRVLSSAMSHFGLLDVIIRVIRDAPLEWYVWRACWLGLLNSECNFLARSINRAHRSLENRRNWWILNCRPARWVRKFIQ